MAILHHKEEKIQVVLGRLPKSYTHEQFVEMFIKLYSKDWGKIKSAYIKQSQDKEPGTVISMPKPDLYLKQLVETYLTLNAPIQEEVKEVEVIKTKTPAKKKVENTEEVVKKPKAVAKNKIEVIADKHEVVKKAKTTVKKVLAAKEEAPDKEVKKKAPAKKKVEAEKIEKIKPKTVKTTKK
ncbi:MAG: hypothetical protein K2P75_03055 [Sphingobacteriaceae bacterium]|nr:hypothetical protein [Sphingobacteriaceae bacterium]